MTNDHCKKPTHTRRALGGERRFLVIPAFNEERHLAEVLNAVEAVDLGLEGIVVDDGSEDRTAEIAKGAGFRVVRHPFNLGYGVALQTGYKLALGEGASVVVQMDADGQHDPSDIPALLEPIEKEMADLVIGSRFLTKSEYRMSPFLALGRNSLHLVSIALGFRITDPTSGFQALNDRVLSVFTGDSFPSDYPDLDALLIARRGGIRVLERAVTMKAGSRRSTLHSGLAPLYYRYKMALSIWAEVSLAPISDDSSGFNRKGSSKDDER
jgi:glycosyltransferase involved in cell wall biosynthesis